jgi:hypothetical protein
VTPQISHNAIISSPVAAPNMNLMVSNGYNNNNNREFGSLMTAGMHNNGNYAPSFSYNRENELYGGGGGGYYNQIQQQPADERLIPAEHYYHNYEASPNYDGKQRRDFIV